MTNLKLFESICTEQPEMLQKLVPVCGDITMEGLGLNEEDEARLAEEVEVVFHCAATINFTEPLRVSVNMNMLGTKRVIALSHKMTNIKAFIHVSTAYGNCHLPEVSESIYPAPIDPGRMIQLTEWFDDGMLKVIQPELVSPRPNTYTFTKALTENLLCNDIGTIPYSIVRPSIVCASWREPVPGWIDNLFAFTGILLGVGKGFLRTLYAPPEVALDFIPVDIPINLMIASAWNLDVQKYKINGDQIYTCSSSQQNPLTIDVIYEYCTSSIYKYPLNSTLWYPGFTSRLSKFTFHLHMFFSNIIPAYITDGILTVLRKKPFAVKLCDRMLKTMNTYEYFMTRNWKFDNTNTRNLYKALSPVDKDIFNFDISQVDWKSYMDTYQLGVKQYILKEPLSGLDGARKSMTRLYWLDWIVKLIMMYSAWCIVSSDSACNLYSNFFHGVSHILKSVPFFIDAEKSGLLVNTSAEAYISYNS